MSVNQLFLKRGALKLTLTVNHALAGAIDRYLGAHLWMKTGKNGGMHAMYISPHAIVDCRLCHPSRDDDNAVLWIGPRAAVDIRPRELDKVMAFLRPFGIIESRPASVLTPEASSRSALGSA